MTNNTGPWHLIGCAHDNLRDESLPRKSASRLAAVEWEGSDDYFFYLIDDRDSDVKSLTVQYQDPELYGEHEGGDWQWATRDRRDMEIEYGYSPTKDEAMREAETRLTGQGTLFAKNASRTAKTTTLSEAEKMAIVNEAGEANNLHKLQLEGTHYLDEDSDFDLLLFNLF